MKYCLTVYNDNYLLRRYYNSKEFIELQFLVDKYFKVFELSEETFNLFLKFCDGIEEERDSFSFWII